MRARWLLPLLGSLALVLVSAGCEEKAGTFVHLKFGGSVSPGVIKTISVDLTLAGEPSSASFTTADPEGIKLPNDASLTIRHGEGTLSVTARALAVDGTVLGTGNNSGLVTRDKTIEIEILFSPGAGVVDGGVVGDGGNDSDYGDGGRRDGSGADAVRRDGMSDGRVISDVPSKVDADYVPPEVDAPITDDAAGAGGASGAGGSAAGGATGAGGTTGAGGAPGPDARTPDVASTGGTPAPDAAVDVHVPSYKLSLNPTSLDFDVVVPGTPSAAKTITVTNQGDAASPALTVGLAEATPFTVSADNCKNVTLAPGATCTVSFIFTPAATGGARVAGTVTPAGGTVSNFTLEGAGGGTQAELLLSPATIDFDIVDVGQSATKVLTLRNIGTVATAAVSIQLTGSAAFKLANDGCTGVMLTGAGQCTVSVVFTPTTYGPASTKVDASAATLKSSSNASGTGRDTVAVTVEFDGNGSGTVTGGGVSCSSATTCTVNVPRTSASDVLVLSGDASSSSSFVGWSVGTCEGTDPCEVSLASPPIVTATFNLKRYILSVTLAGAGSGTVTSSPTGIECGEDCSAIYDRGTDVTLTASAASGSAFTGWTGGDCGTSTTCKVRVTAATSVTATFAKTYSVNVTVVGNGTVTSDPAGIDCGTDCSQDFEAGSSVVLEATPGATNWPFKSWSGGGCSGTATKCTVTVNAAKTVTATFKKTVSCTYQSSVTCSTGGGVVDTKYPGVTTSSACQTNCASLFTTNGIDSGCWSFNGMNPTSPECWCRGGTLSAGTLIGGSCE